MTKTIRADWSYELVWDHDPDTVISINEGEVLERLAYAYQNLQHGALALGALKETGEIRAGSATIYAYPEPDANDLDD